MRFKSKFSSVALFTLLVTFIIPSYAQEAELTLERAVLVMRHGVRPPTKSAKAMAAWSDSSWPDDAAWGAAPGELTPHGAESIRKLGVDLRHFYASAGLLPEQGSISEKTLLWADGADQRTRATAHFLAQGLTTDQTNAPAVAWSANATDPLFDALSAGVCKLDPIAAQKAVLENGPIDTPKTNAALANLQKVMAPLACNKGPGMCLAEPSKLSTSATEVKLLGPLATGATVAEILLLEYENGLPLSQVGWGRVSRDDIASLLLIHEHASNLTRRTPYIALRRADSLVRFILAALSENSVSSTIPKIAEQNRLIVLAGHDTNLSNLAGVFNLNWHLPDQPDVTAPGTAIAFERWRDNKTGQALLRMRLFYQGMEQVRELQGEPLRQIPLMPAACQAKGKHCELADVVQEVMKTLPTDCQRK
ncbi:histidine-type phosphatase [Solimicrobium silvestre]|uniref:Histidine phosphatase superfamily (Branch 2) n=1 Tax=Solimicrobium silvestre TaxID=2099400 RepID=A0A2S9H545_9BURK|nr:histidine-type phosphatase [Solimicrobium silvestre]PRC95112.1 Histidine phosphatase superfamily (branch 2) [Solimicrobium silvestre]